MVSSKEVRTSKDFSIRVVKCLSVDQAVRISPKLPEHNNTTTLILLTGILIIVVLLALILTKTTSALVALILVPIVGALIAGFGLETAEFAVAGIKSIAPVLNPL